MTSDNLSGQAWTGNPDNGQDNPPPLGGLSGVSQSGEFREDLGTAVVALVYDFTTRTGVLVLPELCCTDMGGAIALFETIDPGVTRIETVAGETPDTTYTRRGGDWLAALPLREPDAARPDR